MNRFGETPGEGRFYRTERYIEINTAWYLVLRGGKQHGPFESRNDAKQALADLLSVPGNSEPRRSRDRSQHKSMKNHADAAKPAHLTATNVTRLRPVREANQTRIEFTAVADDVMVLFASNTLSANEENAPQDDSRDKPAE